MVARGTRRTDRVLASRIHAALGDARTVLNVGAGTGSYEPRDREALAVEPSAIMRAQRAPRAAPAIPPAQRAPGPPPAIAVSAAPLPSAAASFDATMAVLTDHHWPDRVAGL